MKPELINSLKGYKKKNILNDMLAGLMVAIIALPLSMALGIQSVPSSVSNNGIQMGIITAIVAGFFISALGGSKFQIGGPTAAFVSILFGYLLDPEIGIAGLVIASIMAGIILILLGVIKAGNVMKFFPYPITIGFTTGIGITLIIGQIKDFCGLKNIQGAGSLEKVLSYIENISTFDLPTFIVGLIGFLIVFFLPKINKKIPSAFVAIIVCTLFTILFNDVLGKNVATLGSSFGDIKAEFYFIDFSIFSNVNFGKLIVPSLVIAFLCAIESLLSATVASGMTGTNFNSNQELMAQGIANIGSALCGGLPATGAIARTAAGIENGAKSPLTGMFHAVFVLIMYFALMGVVKYVPMAVFASILMGVAINMSRFPLFAKLLKFGIRDVIVLIFTCVITVIFDLTYGVIGGIIVAIICNAQAIKTGFVVKITNEKNIENSVEIENLSLTDGKIKAKGSVWFANVHKLTSAMDNEFKNVNKITLDFNEVCNIDQTALEKLVKYKKSLEKINKTFEVVGATEKVQNRISKFKTIL